MRDDTCDTIIASFWFYCRDTEYSFLLATEVPKERNESERWLIIVIQTNLCWNNLDCTGTWSSIPKDNPSSLCKTLVQVRKTAPVGVHQSVDCCDTCTNKQRLPLILCTCNLVCLSHIWTFLCNLAGPDWLSSFERFWSTSKIYQGPTVGIK